MNHQQNPEEMRKLQEKYDENDLKLQKQQEKIGKMQVKFLVKKWDNFFF